VIDDSAIPDGCELLDVILVQRLDGEGPAIDPESALMAAAVGAGFHFPDSQPMRDEVEMVNGETVRRTTWAILACTVRCDGEELSFEEFRARFEDLEWIAANRGSKIAALHMATMGLHEMHRTIFQAPPGCLVRNGMLWAYIAPDTSEEEADRLISQIM
jgi:hypothetical protein